MTSFGAVILVVDDDDGGRYAKCRILRFSGFDVREAATGKEVFESVLESSPDLVLLDVSLPDISGYDVCRRLKSDLHTSRIPVVMTSAAYTKGADRARGLEGGADGYLVEPIEPEVMQATISSILRSREAAEISRQATVQWEATFTAISDGIALLNREGVIYRCNKAFRELSRGVDSIGMPFETWLLNQGAHVPLSMSALLHAHERQVLEVEFAGRWYELTLDPVIGEVQSEGSVAICKDVTKRRESEREIVGARNLAEIANAAKDRFLAVLSHELRTPLTPILMSVDVMMSDPDITTDTRMGLEMIQRNIELEARLIDDLLDLTRIVQGKMSLRMVSVELEKLATLAIEMSNDEIVRKGIRLSVDLGDHSSIVNCDPARMQQVLWNLIKNAAKFTPTDGTIAIRSYQPSATTVAIEVADSGIGIAKEALARVFEPFEQADNSITRRFGGLGLGLAISKNIVDLHNGKLTVASGGEGSGTTFTLALSLV